MCIKFRHACKNGILFLDFSLFLFFLTFNQSLFNRQILDSLPSDFDFEKLILKCFPLSHDKRESSIFQVFLQHARMNIKKCSLFKRELRHLLCILQYKTKNFSSLNRNIFQFFLMHSFSLLLKNFSQFSVLFISAFEINLFEHNIRCFPEY